jgi:hypothetical protein
VTPRAALLGLALALLAAGAQAHTRSQSFSTWRLDGEELVARFSVAANEVTRLAAADDPALPLDALLARHLEGTVRASAGGSPCLLVAEPQALAAVAGQLRVELRFACGPGRPLALEIAAFDDVAPSHVHFARFAHGAAPPQELLFTDRARRRVALGAVDEPAPQAGFGGYLALGVEHIALGPDHLAFLCSLLLFARRARDVLVFVTGFTLGHSVTLALGALALARPDPALVEAWIGFTIALVAAENVSAPAGASARIGALAAAALAGLALASGLFGLGPPAAWLAGLALFTVCYARLADSRAAVVRLRPLLTVVFGLIHGFGFAGVLLEIGLPRERLVAALLGFNLGVELGQLAFVAALGLALLALRRLAPRVDAGLAHDAASAALCGLGLYWFAGRAYGLLPP